MVLHTHSNAEEIRINMPQTVHSHPSTTVERSSYKNSDVFEVKIDVYKVTMCSVAFVQMVGRSTQLYSTTFVQKNTTFQL